MCLVDRFREPVVGVNRRECKMTVSCPSRFPEQPVRKYGWPRYHGRVLARAPLRGCTCSNLGGTAIEYVIYRPRDPLGVSGTSYVWGPFDKKQEDREL